MANIKGTKYFSVGDKRINNAGDEFTIIEYIDSGNVVIKWPCGQEDIVRSGNIHNRSIAYYNRPSVQGVGFLGYGRFVHALRELKEGEQYTPRHLHRHWRHLIERTHGDVPSRYEDATLDKSWYNLQNFLEWAMKQIGNSDKESNGRYWCIDKDILVDGNKLYSKETCTFVPNEVNVFFSKKEIGNAGYLGVNYIKPATKGAKEGYIARCHFGGERKYLGYYNAPNLAYQAYRAAKVGAAKELANKWDGKVDERVIAALRNFEERLPVDL